MRDPFLVGTRIPGPANELALETNAIKSSFDSPAECPKNASPVEYPVILPASSTTSAVPFLIESESSLLRSWPCTYRQIASHFSRSDSCAFLTIRPDIFFLMGAH